MEPAIHPPHLRERFLAGDPLRGLAALGVFAVHAGSLAVTSTGYGELLAAPGGYVDAYGTIVSSLLVGGGIGFLLFFVLSGYLIGGPFVRAIVKGGPGPRLATFVRNRVLRVVPAYWVVLTLLLLIVVWIAGEARVSAGEMASLYVFHVTPDSPLLPWIGQAWTLEIEAKFYVVIPIAALLLAPALRGIGSPLGRALAIAGLCLGWFVAAPLVQPGPVVGNPFHHFLALLLAGVAIAALEPVLRPYVVQRALSWARVGTIALLAGTAYVMASLALASEIGAPFNTDWGELAVDVAVLAILTGALVYQWATGGCWRLLDNPFTRWIGTRSYSFYLVHLALLWAVGKGIATLDHGYKVTLLLLVPAGLLATALVAEGLYRAVERPFLDWKRGEVAPPRPARTPSRMDPVAETV